MAHSITSGKRARDDEDSDENMLSDGSSTVLSSSAPTEEPEQPTKRLQLDVDKDGSSPESSQVVRCSLPPHEGLSFPTFDAFEVHYEQHHLHRCSECHKNFPSDHYLQLHIAENHDPITAVKMERGERTFACFVEDCDRRCSSAQKRRRHMIDKHGFPKLYDFFVVNDGIDRRTSMLRGGGGRPKSRAQKKAPESPQTLRKEAESDAQVSSLTQSMSALKFVPRNLKFGRGGSKAFAR